MAGMRIDQFLSKCGAGSRSEAKQYLKKGLVTINGTVVKAPDFKVIPESDTILLNGKILEYEAYEYVMLYKPTGCITATRDARQKTVMDYLGKSHKLDLAPVGRLDIDTEGLLILTNDGDLAHRMLSPKSHVDKVYYARVLGHVTDQDVDAFAAGIDIGEKRLTLPAELTILRSGEISETEVVICEGKFHQIKRMFEVCGKKVLYLKRISMGGLDLDASLMPGQWRKLSSEEVLQLRTACERRTQC